MSHELIREIKRRRLIIIVRGITGETLLKTAAAIAGGGGVLVELAFDGSRDKDETVAADLYRLKQEFRDDLCVGAGTVLHTGQVQIAYSAGARYIVSPNCDPDVIEATKNLGMLSVPGGFTPTEIVKAKHCGADLVKLFPGTLLGVEYVRAVKTPLSHIDLMVMGGVTLENAMRYLEAGAAGVGVSSSIINREYIENGQFDKIKSVCKAYAELCGNDCGGSLESGRPASMAQSKN